jgi:hypothetical protein
MFNPEKVFEPALFNKGLQQIKRVMINTDPFSVQSRGNFGARLPKKYCGLKIASISVIRSY